MLQYTTYMEALLDTINTNIIASDVLRPAQIGDRLTVSWLGRTATGSVQQTPESLAARHTGNVPYADVYHFQPDTPVPGEQCTPTWIVPSECVPLVGTTPAHVPTQHKPGSAA